MQPFHRLTAALAAVHGDDIDTDRIIPARFLKGTDREGLGRALFADWRPGTNGEAPFHGRNAANATVLVAGRNFGCGSSREHAVWALMDHGFRAVLALGFSDIFRTNALENGLLPVTIDEATHAALLSATEHRGTNVTIDLDAQRLTLPDGSTTAFAIEPFARRCLLDGQDRLDVLLAHLPALAARDATRPASPPTHALVKELAS